MKQYVYFFFLYISIIKHPDTIDLFTCKRADLSVFLSEHIK